MKLKEILFNSSRTKASIFFLVCVGLIILSVLFLTLFKDEYKKNTIERVIKTDIQEVQVKAVKVSCSQGFCSQTFAASEIKETTLMHQPDFNKIQKGKNYYLYYLIKEKKDSEEKELCILNVSDVKRDKNKINQQYTNKNLFAILCIKPEDFLMNTKSTDSNKDGK